MNHRYGSLLVAALLVASTFAFLPSVAAYSPATNFQAVPNWNVTLPPGGNGGNGGHSGGGGGGGGHSGGGGGGFTCPTIKGADQSVCSTNWSGYADAASSGSVTSVAGSWTLPALTCPSSGTTYIAIWVGIDGYSSSTVEQTGILGECYNGAASYSAWYEFYPNPMVQVSGTVKPGNTISATVTYSGSSFTATISDPSTGLSSHTTASVSNAQRTSAEWIVERPALCIGAHCSLSTLASFGSSTFSSGSATIGGTSGSIISFSNVAITMVGGSSGPILAEPSTLVNSGTSFTVNYG